MILPKLMITDIDGVWTNGGMYYTEQGDVMKLFSVKDGWGVSMLRLYGIETVIMTGEQTDIVTQRAKKLKIERCFLGVKDKLQKAKELCDELQILLQDVAFIGDDINDLRLLQAVGLSAAPANAPHYVKSAVDIVTVSEGGDGAFREFVETILVENGLFEDALKRLL